MLGSSSMVKIREAEPKDAGQLEEVYRRFWRYAYTGVIPHDRLDVVLARRGVAWWRRALKSGDRVLLVEVLGTVAGYASFGVSRHGGSEEGEIYELYLAPAYQGIGLGELLFEACRGRIDACGLRGLIVWVLSENDAARDFYLRRGGRPAYQRSDRTTGHRLEKVAYLWE
jgi:ribosomal protein S18 acetylase RimI-like enzyme